MNKDEKILLLVEIVDPIKSVELVMAWCKQHAAKGQVIYVVEVPEVPSR